MAEIRPLRLSGEARVVEATQRNTLPKNVRDLAPKGVDMRRMVVAFRLQGDMKGAPPSQKVLPPKPSTSEFIGNLLVRIHSIIDLIWGTGLAPWEF